MKKYQEGGVLGQSSSLSPWVGPYVGEMLGRGAALAGMDYTPYQGPLTAGQSALQGQAFQGLANLAVPTATTTGSFTGTGYEPLSAEQIAAGATPTLSAPTNVVQQYMNPYLEGALLPQYDAARRQSDIERTNLQSRYGKAGAYGGGRQAIAEAELQRGLLDRISGITGQGYQQAYDKAADLFGQERQYGLQGLQQQLAAGQQQRAIEQEGVLADIAQFEQERDYPYKQVQYMQSLLQGLPISTQSYQYAQPTGLSNFFGGAGGGISILQGLGFLPTSKE